MGVYLLIMFKSTSWNLGTTPLAVVRELLLGCIDCELLFLYFSISTSLAGSQLFFGPLYTSLADLSFLF